jgi:excisionase family DNA binding protein
MLMEGQEELGVAEAARFLERSTEQVRRYLREGRLSGRRIGGQWFIKLSDLERFRSALREQHSFLEKLRPASELNPLESVIGIGAGGGSNIADGKDAYRRAFWWRR